MEYQIIQGDCLEVMKGMEENSIDALVTDPPYGLSFMGKNWDHGVPGEEFWRAALRAAKPGCHLLAFGGTRTFHRLACAIEDAGWEIRDCIMWVYGSGFPKSLDVSKAMDKAAGAEREIVGQIRKTPSAGSANMNEGWRRPWAETKEKTMDITAPATAAAKQWDGWGTALKPAWEPILVARKPLAGTVVENVLHYGTGGINVDGCRIGTDRAGWGGAAGGQNQTYSGRWKAGEAKPTIGRWPANVIHDGSEEVMELFPDSFSNTSIKAKEGKKIYYGSSFNESKTCGTGKIFIGDGFGSAARFFYCAKASKQDRDEGLEDFICKKSGSYNMRTDAHAERMGAITAPRGNYHPTVKPTELMRYLCRLVTPPEGIILDPFCGSGSTGKASLLEGFRFVGIELDQGYCEIAERRIQNVLDRFPLFKDSTS